MDRPGVGIGVIIENEEGKILVGKRIGSHAPFYSIPGGHLENGETFEEAAIKEVFEETGLSILQPRVIGISNNLDTYHLEGKHYISINMHTNQFTGEVINKEVDKCEAWLWVDPDHLPKPHFEASLAAVRSWKSSTIYK